MLSTDQLVDRGATALALLVIASGACAVSLDRGAYFFAAWAGLMALLFFAVVVETIREVRRRGGE